MKSLKKRWFDFVGCLHPWNMKYRIIEKREYSHFYSKIEKTYFVQGRLKYTPFWFRLEDKDYEYFVQAYRIMKTLMGVPKTTKRALKDHECVLLLMDEGDGDDEV